MTGRSKEKTVRIRDASVSDVPVILAFIKGIAEFEKLSHEVIATEDVIEETLFGERPSAHVILAEIDGEASGFAVYFYNFSTFVGRPGIYIEDIYVSEEKRGLGVGEAMMRHLAGIAKRRNCSRMEWAVLTWNPARTFYEALGAEPLDDWLLYRISGEALERLGGD
jgi:GNAT superfamily N-acetyltransferase